jgi:hypothetical protein
MDADPAASRHEPGRLLIGTDLGVGPGWFLPERHTSP